MISKSIIIMTMTHYLEVLNLVHVIIILVITICMVTSHRVSGSKVDRRTSSSRSRGIKEAAARAAR